MTVGFAAPLPPAPTGVADYAASLLVALQRHGTVALNARRPNVWLYHLGNNHLHLEIYRRALARPGVVVLHDAVLQHFFLGALTGHEYVEEFVFNYGEWHRELARELWRGRTSSSFSQRYYAYPMLRRIAEVSHAVVVHNPAAARMVREHAPRARIVEIPHLFAPVDLPPGADVERYRQTLGLSPRQFVFGVFGYLRESKRVMNILRAFDRIHRAAPHTVLLVAGDFVTQDLARAAEPLLGAPGVLRLPHLPEQEFWMAASAVDACINLRYPGAGETSGIAVRLMGIAKPVMLTLGEETSRYAETACFRIPPGVAEKASLTEHSMVAASLPQAAREIGKRGAMHIHSFHSLDLVAELYWETLCAHRC